MYRISRVVHLEKRLTATIGKLSGEIAGLTRLVHCAEKISRDLIQLKVAADWKFYRDIKVFGHLEIQTWRMDTISVCLHICQYDSCFAS